MRVVFLVTLATLALSAPIQHETSSPAAGHHAFSLNSLVGSIASSSTTIVSTACKWLTTGGRAPSAEVVAARGVEVALAQADVMTGWAMEDEEEREDRCFSACNRRWVAGMDTSDGGPCSDESLNNTLECAQCIDSMWPPKENEQSALAEYSALVLSCQAEWPM